MKSTMEMNKLNMDELGDMEDRFFYGHWKI